MISAAVWLSTVTPHAYPAAPASAVPAPASRFPMAAPKEYYHTPIGSVRLQTEGLTNVDISDKQREQLIDDFIESKKEQNTETMLFPLYRRRTFGNDHVRDDQALDTVKRQRDACD